MLGAAGVHASPLALHGSPESFSSHRVGLGHVLLYRGEWTRKQLDAVGGMDAKRAQLWEIYPELKGNSSPRHVVI